MPAQFNIYSSSAGSGKTFTLTKEYLKLALRTDQAWYFKRILAITFTNDAANEMKERILDALRAFADMEGFDERSKFWGMFQMIVAETNIPEMQIQFRAGQVYHKILQEFSDFSVKTIDSFVNQLVAAFTDDLGLPFNYEIVLDSDTVLTEAIERLIEKAGLDEHRELSTVLERYIAEKTDDGKSWASLPRELADFGKHLLNDQFYASISQLNHIEIRHFRRIQSQMRAFLQDFEENIKTLAQQAVDLIESEGLTMEDFFQKKSGIASYFLNLSQRFEEKIFFDPNSYHKKAIYDGVFYTVKSTPLPIQQKIDSIEDELVSIFKNIEEAREKLLPKYILFQKMLPNFYRLSLLKKIKTEFDDVLQEKNQVFIAEFNRKVLQIVLNEPVPFIYEKIGEKFNHILIDEFQDTSDMQFYNLLPLVENSLAKNHFNLLVGDAKQSIYRWRGGKMELIVHLYRKDMHGLLALQELNDFQQEQIWNVSQYTNPVNLNTNFRSTAEVIDFNNDFFQTICEQRAVDFPFLAQVYQDFEQKKPAHAQEGGHVQIELLEKSDENLEMLTRTHELIKNALAEGYQQKDIAILSRTKSHLAQLANHLKEHDPNIRLISQDSLLLKNAHSIALIMSFLRVLQHPDNYLAKYEAAYLFYQKILHEFPDTIINAQIKEIVEAPDIQAFYDFFEAKGYHINSYELQRVGLYEMAERIIGAFRLFEQGNEQVYLFRFLDIIWDFGLKQSNHLADFLQYWEEKKKSLSVQSSDEQDAITITTIHQSKGLEYPVVIIPFANWATAPRPTNEFWVNFNDIYEEMWWHDEQDGQVVLAASPMKFAKELEKTIVAEPYRKELESYFLESLNLLYVAFTRAVEQLYILSELPKRQGRKEVGELMRLYLEANGFSGEVAGVYPIFEGKRQEQKQKIALKKSEIVLRKILTEDRSEKLRLRRLSEKIFDENVDKSKDFGNKVHAAFAEIRTHADLATALWKLQNTGIINHQEEKTIRAGVEKVMALPELQKLFTEGLRVENEREILLPNGDMFRPDRVVFCGDEIHIIDYKTGSHRTPYENQIKRYGQFYQQMYPTKQVLLKLVYLEAGEVREV